MTGQAYRTELAESELAYLSVAAFAINAEVYSAPLDLDAILEVVEPRYCTAFLDFVEKTFAPEAVKWNQPRLIIYPQGTVVILN